MEKLDRRSLVLGFAAAAGTGFATTSLLAGEDDSPRAPLAAPEPIQIDARTISHFDRGRPETRHFGDLEFRGGLVLTSPSPQFGGWSGLVMAGDGRSLLTISDVGSWLSAEVKYDAGRLAGLTNGRIGPLLAQNGQPLVSKHEQDAESLALLNGSIEHGTVLVGFERFHRIAQCAVRASVIQAPSAYVKLPAEAKRMRPNQGIEALAVLQAGPYKGSIVAFAERLTGGTGYHTGWLWVNGEARRFQLRDLDGFNITDAAGLVDGGLLVLERYFRWSEGVKMRVRRLLPGEIAPGGRLTGHTVVEADMNYEIDNMEGISLHRNSAGQTIVSLISDDNFNHFLQRTLLLQFALRDGGPKSASRP